MEGLRLEHFKSLKEEYRQYLFQVQQLWIFKLSTMGLVIAAAIFNDKLVQIQGIKAETVVGVGILMLPFLALAIDLKTLEIGLHVKVISNHLKETFCDVSEISKWESELWSGNRFSSLRTRLTVISSVGMSLVVLAASIFVVSNMKPGWTIPLIILGMLLIALTIAVTSRTLPKLDK